MATYRTRDPMDAARFVRALQERGYTKDTRRLWDGGGMLRDCYRVKCIGKFTIQVAYYEPNEPRHVVTTPTPSDARKYTRHHGCTEPLCNRKHWARGLCKKHWQRWKYNTDAEYREKKLRQMAEYGRAKRKAKREEAA